MPVIVNLDDTFDLEVKNDTAWDLRREALEEGHGNRGGEEKHVR